MSSSSFVGILDCATADDASHNLELASIFRRHFLRACASTDQKKIKKKGSFEMGVAFQINFSLWLMIACAALEANRLIEYLN